MSKRLVRIYAVIASILVTWNVVPYHEARADIGWPPLNPSGVSPGVPAGVDTNVRMISEEVRLTIESHQRSAPDGELESPANWMRGLVEASFQMHNLGETQESFDVWFPLAASVRYPGLLPYTPENIVQDFKVWIDGLPVKTEQVKAPDLSDPQQESAWARFPMTFPPGQDVMVRVNYTIYPSGRRPFGDFEYILQTGAGWKGTIGQATIIAYLPYTVTAENVSMSGNSIEGLPLAPQPAGYVIENNTIRWQLTDFEPTSQDNIFLNVLEPERYYDLQRARARLQEAPDSADAHIELATAAQNALMIVKQVGKHGGGANLADQVAAAYRRALELVPERVEIYARYARWLLQSGGWISLMRDGTCPPELCDLVRRGLEAFPGDPELTSIDEEIRMMQQEFAPFATQTVSVQTASAQTVTAETTRQALSATPAQQTLESTTPILAASTQPATLAPSATPVPLATSERPGGICPAVALPLIFVAVMLMQRKLPNGS